MISFIFLKLLPKDTFEDFLSLGRGKDGYRKFGDKYLGWSELFYIEIINILESLNTKKKFFQD